MTGIGSQYIWATMDANKQYFDGSKTCRVTLPKGIPQERFWSLTLYDNQLRSMLDTPQRYPPAGSQSYPSPAASAEADGSTVVSFGPEARETKRNKRRQLDSDYARERVVRDSAAYTARCNRSSIRVGDRARLRK
jgi:hypothetical protein